MFVNVNNVKSSGIVRAKIVNFVRLFEDGPNCGVSEVAQRPSTFTANSDRSKRIETTLSVLPCSAVLSGICMQDMNLEAQNPVAAGIEILLANLLQQFDAIVAKYHDSATLAALQISTANPLLLQFRCTEETFSQCMGIRPQESFERRPFACRGQKVSANG